MNDIYFVDAFTDRPFAGNPAAVCFPDRPRDDAWMQALAKEIGFSETAFLLPLANGYSLRWFTPAIEVDLCGHATLAGAHILWESGRLAAAEPAIFHSRSGRLSAKKRQELIELDFPCAPVSDVTPPEGLLESLGLQAAWVGRSKSNYFVVVESEELVRTATPDFPSLKKCFHGEVGVIVSSRSSSPDYDVVSRFFAPGAGIDEDPVTGSAHCSIGPYWSQLLGKDELRAFQASARGGFLWVRTGAERVFIAGQAVTVMQGRLAPTL
jgi:PhzF family phenazine biosynthesis protein